MVWSIPAKMALLCCFSDVTRISCFLSMVSTFLAKVADLSPTLTVLFRVFECFEFSVSFVRFEDEKVYHAFSLGVILLQFRYSFDQSTVFFLYFSVFFSLIVSIFFEGFDFLDHLLYRVFAHVKSSSESVEFTTRIVEGVGNVPVSHELDKCVPPQVFTYLLSF